MTVDTFDPKQFDPSRSSGEIDAVLLASAVKLGLALSHTTQQLSLLPQDIEALAPLVVHAAWPEQAHVLSEDELVGLIRLFTLGEGQFSSWQAGSKSAVIKLVRELKQRSLMPGQLTTWIKANTDNRFLPHGDLMDRL